MTPPTLNRKEKEKPAPFSLRLTFEERARLEQEAGNMPLGAHIRSKLFHGKEAPRRPVKRRRRKPFKDEKALGELLGKMGQARLASNINQFAKAANSGSLPVTPETEKALQDACSDVRIMRFLLMRALGHYSSEA